MSLDFIGLTLASVFICRLFSVSIPLLLIFLCGCCEPIALTFQ